MGLTPEYRITANDNDITAMIKERFISLRLTDEAGFKSDSMELELADHDDEKQIELPPTGAELEVWLGYDKQAQKMGLYIVDEIELSGPPNKLIIRAKASPQDETGKGKSSLLTQKTRSWNKGLKLTEMVSTIATNHNLKPAVSGSLSEIVLPHIDQVNESDISLLTRVVKDYDAIAKPVNGMLVLAMRGASKTISDLPLPVMVLTPPGVSSWRMTQSKRHPAGTVIATWRNMATAQDVEVKIGDGEPVKRLKHQYKDSESAEKAARTEYNKRKRAEKKLSISMPGNSSVMAESPLNMQSFRDGVNGEWVVTRVEHLVSESGYRCSISAETLQK